MKYKWIKKERRKINKWVKNVNKALEDDPLWKGRFFLKQRRIPRFETFEDGSGGIIVIEFKIIDKQTGLNRIFYRDNFDYHWSFIDINDFIVKDVDVWKEHPTRETTKDYKTVTV